MLGVDYYPEHWPPERFPIDIKMMRSSGIRIVRIGEFAWSKIEPEEGKYRIEWLEDIVDKLAKEGFSIIIGTPTASPPPWAARKYPDSLVVDYMGNRAVYGVRRQFCPNNPTYRKLCEKIILKIVRAFSSNESVIGYQIDNELHYGESNPWRYCYCQYCIRSFREYLKKKYGALEDLNRKAGTAFWSHEYRDWEEIIPPAPPFDLYNRTLALEWIRFRSESFIEFANFQKELIKSVDPEKIVTTNLMGVYPEIDYYKLGETIDVPSNDIYPRFGRDEYDPSSIAMVYDATRCMSKKGRFWITELQSGPTDGYNVVSVDGRIQSLKIGLTPEPGELRKWFWQAVAHGAEKVLFFRWRTYHSGKEEFWHGILDHNGLENRRLKEVKAISKEVEKVSDELEKAHVQASTALLFSHDSLWSADVTEYGYYDITYLEYLYEVYKSLFSLRLQVDVISPRQDLSRYKLVIAPFLYLASKDLLKKLDDYVKRGGFLILTARSMVKDELNRVRFGFDGERVAVEEFIGGAIKEYTRLPPNEKGALIRLSEFSPILPRESIMCRFWLDVFSPSEGAEVLGYHNYKWLAGEPAIISNSRGAGKVITIGTLPDWATFREIINSLLPRLGVKPLVKERVGQSRVEFSMLQSNDARYLFVINHSSEAKKTIFTISGEELTPLLRDRRMLIDDNGVEKMVKLELNPHDVEIIKIT